MYLTPIVIVLNVWSLISVFLIYTVNHKKGGRKFVIITLENLDGFL